MDWLLVVNLLVLAIGSLILVHSFFLNVFIKPLHEEFMQTADEVKA